MNKLEKRRFYADKACTVCRGQGTRWLHDPDCPKCKGAGFSVWERTGEITECPCEIGAPVPCSCHINEKIRVWTELARIPTKNLGSTVAGYIYENVDEKKVRDSVIQWLDKFSVGCNGLYLFGSPGTGKTHLATAICNNLIRVKDTLPLYVSATELITKAMSRFGREVELADPFIPAYDADVLVLDDFGIDKPSDWAIGKFTELIDRRYREGLTTIFTSNLNIDNVEELYGARIADRIHETCKILHCNGRSRRRQEAAA